MSSRGRHAVESPGDRPAARQPGRWRLIFGSTSGWMLAVVLLLFAGYLVVFYRTTLPSVGSGLRRIDLIQFGLLLPEQIVEVWFGHPPEFALADRLPVLGVALGILAISAIFGRQLLSLFCMDWGLTSLEKVLFACGIGLNAFLRYV